MADDLLKQLAFDGSPSFLRAGERAFETAPAYGHIFRRATEKRRGDEPGPGLIGVYTLRPSDATQNTPGVPALYICRATSAAAADRAHQLVWNQDVVPFLIVETPVGYRLYSGFQFDRSPQSQAKNLLRTFNTTAELADAGFHATGINDGELWRTWGPQLRPDARVDWTLLKNLETLDEWLRENGLAAEVSHALIGKYVYLHYLRDRDILSDRKLTAWGIPKESVFGRHATLGGLQRVIGRLDSWLNGGVFPLLFGKAGSPDDRHVCWVASTFAGDEPTAKGNWQLYLDFRAYDFSYIPIEILSVIYEQFLHAATGDARSRGKDAGAYYTPIPVVNFMLAELEDRKALDRGMRILDPSCGSGAFLVQCYRRLIEKEYPAAASRPRPAQLRDLLQRSIFGVDRDADACSVAEMSLILTLLDYCDPPDLEDHTQFKLPTLRNTNIFAENFFRRDPDCLTLLGRRRFDWIVGNPPWKGLNPKRLAPDDVPVWEWMQGQAEHRTPVGDNEVAEAFAWEVERYMAADAVAGLLLPALVLFKDLSAQFRATFFRRFRVHSIANFSNLTEALFAGRSRDPAAAFFYSVRPEETTGAMDSPGPEELISVYSPLVANQELTRPQVEGRRNETWSLVLNASEVRSVRLSDALRGNALPWKLSAWGSHLDLRLIEKVEARFDSLGKVEESGLLTMTRGPELFTAVDAESSYDLVRCDEVVGKKLLDVNPLKRLRRIFAFPPDSIKDNEKTYLRKRGGTRGLTACRPPHVVASAAGNFAVFYDDYLVIPSGQFGIVSPTGDARLLKALTLYLNSDFALYHQFLTASHLGVKRPRVHLVAFRRLPLPVARLDERRLGDWAALHDRLARASRKVLAKRIERPLFGAGVGPVAGDDMKDLLERLNQAVYEALDLKGRDQALVEDLVRVRLQLDDGRAIGVPAVAPPKAVHIRRYAKRLKSELDDFLGNAVAKRHEVNVVHDGHSGMIQVAIRNGGNAGGIGVYEAD
ncbi:MAG TPA: N-6 DNA methylase, partial [Tepidisphaeraceae bacterium]|nr:N-6 DNA methylase [Tepidisphaeraceae bacterium]